jgi:hypothetical protein
MQVSGPSSTISQPATDFHMWVGENSGPFDLAYSNSILLLCPPCFRVCCIAAFCRALRTSRIRVESIARFSAMIL